MANRWDRAVGQVYQTDKLYGLAVDAGVFPPDQSEVKMVRDARGRVVTMHDKGGYIVLVWDEWLNHRDHSKGAICKERTIVVSRERALEAMHNLETEKLYA